MDLGPGIVNIAGPSRIVNIAGPFLLLLLVLRRHLDNL